MAGARPIPPILGNLELINDGTGAFAGQFNNFYFISYSSVKHPNDNIGNYSTDCVTWTPPASGTDPPSHFIITVKDFASDCNFYPTFDLYENRFAIAWIETNPIGRLNLKYENVPLPYFPPIVPPAPIDPNTIPVNSQVIYVFPNVPNLQKVQNAYNIQDVQTENVPMNDIEIIDLAGNTFNLDVFMRLINNRGYELTMPKKVSAIRFGQIFRERKNLQAFLGTAVQEGNLSGSNLVSTPLPNIDITVYYGKTNRIYKVLSTDAFGRFSLVMNPGKYTFQINIDTISIAYYQKFV